MANPVSTSARRSLIGVGSFAMCAAIISAGVRASNGPRPSRESGAQRLAFDERHHVPEQVALGTSAQQRHDPRMLQLRRELDFPAEPIGTHARRQLLRPHLDHHPPPQCDFLGQIDVAHAAAAELALDAVGGAQSSLQLVQRSGHVDGRASPLYPNPRGAASPERRVASRDHILPLVVSRDYIATMRTVGIRELKAHLSRVLRDVQNGETVLVTDRGKVIAELRQPGLATSTLSPIDQKLAELAAKGVLKLAEKPWVGYTASPVKVPPGTLQAIIDDLRDDR